MVIGDTPFKYVTLSLFYLLTYFIIVENVSWSCTVHCGEMFLKSIKYLDSIITPSFINLLQQITS